MSYLEKYMDWAIKNGKAGARIFAITMFAISPVIIVNAVWDELGDDIKGFYHDVYEAVKTGSID